MRRDKNSATNNGEKVSRNDDPASPTSAPPGVKENKFVNRLKKVGLTVWLVVLGIGGALAVMIALFLL